MEEKIYDGEVGEIISFTFDCIQVDIKQFIAYERGESSDPGCKLLIKPRYIEASSMS